MCLLFIHRPPSPRTAPQRQTGLRASATSPSRRLTPDLAHVKTRPAARGERRAMLLVIGKLSARKHSRPRGRFTTASKLLICTCSKRTSIKLCSPQRHFNLRKIGPRVRAWHRTRSPRSFRDPNGEWMKQVARNLTDMWDGFLLGKRYLIHDRDPLFTEAVRGLLRDSGVKPVPSIYSSASPMGRKSALRREIAWILRRFQRRLSWV